LQNSAPERFVLKVPRRLWPWRALALCVPKRSGFKALLASIVAGISLVILHFYAVIPFFIMPLGVPVIGALLFVFALSISSTILIRKDCYECQFGFHIVTHERSHLSLNSLDEVLVEEKTVKQTEDRLIPILLSNPKMCKDCFFKWRKIYCRATFDYLKRNEEKERSLGAKKDN
jgi:hypothetical protein